MTREAHHSWDVAKAVDEDIATISPGTQLPPRDVRLPCASCPWLLENRGRRKWGVVNSPSSARGLRDRWTIVRRGALGPCGEQVDRSCTGERVVAVRELALLLVTFAGDMKRYRQERPRGLTLAGITFHMARMEVFPGQTEPATFDLRAEAFVPELDYPEDAPWHRLTPAQKRRRRSTR